MPLSRYCHRHPIADLEGPDLPDHQLQEYGRRIREDNDEKWELRMDELVGRVTNEHKIFLENLEEKHEQEKNDLKEELNSARRREVDAVKEEMRTRYGKQVKEWMHKYGEEKKDNKELENEVIHLGKRLWDVVAEYDEEIAQLNLDNEEQSMLVERQRQEHTVEIKQLESTAENLQKINRRLVRKNMTLEAENARLKRRANGNRKSYEWHLV